MRLVWKPGVLARRLCIYRGSPLAPTVLTATVMGDAGLVPKELLIMILRYATHFLQKNTEIETKKQAKMRSSWLL